MHAYIQTNIRRRLNAEMVHAEERLTRELERPKNKAVRRTWETLELEHIQRRLGQQVTAGAEEGSYQELQEAADAAMRALLEAEGAEMAKPSRAKKKKKKAAAEQQQPAAPASSVCAQEVPEDQGPAGARAAGSAAHAPGADLREGQSGAAAEGSEGRGPNELSVSLRGSVAEQGRVEGAPELEEEAEGGEGRLRREDPSDEANEAAANKNRRGNKKGKKNKTAGNPGNVGSKEKTQIPARALGGGGEAEDGSSGEEVGRGDHGGWVEGAVGVGKAGAAAGGVGQMMARLDFGSSSNGDEREGEHKGEREGEWIVVGEHGTGQAGASHDPSKILLVRRGEGQGRSTSDDAAAAARSAAAAGGAGARGRDRPTAAPASSCKAVGAAGSKDSKDVDSAAHFLQKVNLSSPRATPPPRPAASPEEAPKANHGSAAAQPPDASTATPAAPPAPAGAPGAVHPVAQAATAATAAAMLSGSECCVCMESRKSHIFVPCGHVCVCGGCADNIMAASKECPICRQVSSLCMKVFMCD